jgi:glutamine amidotransferase
VPLPAAPKKFVIIDYDMGNLKSIANAFKALQVPVEVSGDAAVVREADAIVLPGVGAFGDGMKNLARRGLVEVLQEQVVGRKTPYLGICLGMQFLANLSLEHGEHRGLGWIPGSVIRIAPAAPEFKVPHMGWNDLQIADPESPLFRGIPQGAAVYFVHSYHFVVDSAAEGCVTATTDHGGRIVAALRQKHIFGVQFHPEKSQGAGLAILRNFVDFAAAHAEKSSDSVAARS